MRTIIFKSVLIFTIHVITACLYAQVSLPAVFSDNMVLQRETNAPIWGKAAPNGNVKIVTSWNKQTYTAKADADGNWRVSVKTPSAGGPYTITVSEKNTIRLNNILIGEVWICSGQSNMEWQLRLGNNGEQEIANADYPNIRLFQAKRATSPYPLDDIGVDAGWSECSPATSGYFSAVAYFFGRNLHQSLNVPVGLIHTSWGGTLAEAWTSEESLKEMSEFREAIEEYKNMPVQAEQKDWMTQVREKDFGLKNNVAIAAQNKFNDSDWKTAVVPGLWEEGDLPDTDGLVWFRRTVDIPDNWVGNDLTLSLGAIDDNEITYFNGVQVGATNGYNADRKYSIPSRLVKEGEGVIAVRVIDSGGGGGFHGDPGKMYIAPANKETLRENLDGEWKYKLAVNLKNTNVNLQNKPTSLYNAMIAPLVPYAIKGAIWYQGESNAGRAYQYRALFPLMINDWRSKWGYDFPFYFVQLANYMAVKDEPSESGWAELREAQLQTLRLENTGMATIIDIGEADDIHPRNKQDVGKRLALQALKQAYGKNIVASGPMYAAYRLEGDKIRIFFERNNSGLMIKNGDALKGFSVAGPDKKFYWADAQIDGDEVVVSSPDVKFPIAVRYAWADNPVCNLYNEAGLPASPFRTDDWPGTTINNK
ncbi:MAG: sialate O-acetylesterase [Bacteroidia bacterium]|nr:sialate O-acetylesterase [Bacteroidia bacterium]